MHVDDLNSVTTEGLAVGRAGSNPIPSARLAIALLRQGLLLLLLAPGVGAIPASAAEAGGAQIVCPALLLDHECRAYQADLNGAATANARDALKARYEGMLSQRERACYCIPEHSSILLTQTSADTKAIFSAWREPSSTSPKPGPEHKKACFMVVER